MKGNAPAAERNRAPILGVLRSCLPTLSSPPLAAPKPYRVVEIASGTGQHAVHFTRELEDVIWQPTDIDEAALSSIEAYRLEAGLEERLRPPLRVDVRSPDWRLPCDIVLCANMVHIAPWEASEGLFAGAARSLDPGGLLVLYGPYRFHGAFLAPSNEAFDQSLRSRDPSWGVRDLDDLVALGVRSGLRLERTVDMPANNHCLLFRRETASE